MAVLGQKFPTLLDLVSRMNPNGGVENDIVELLTENNEMLADMGWTEANDGTTNKTVVRTGLPASTWRLLNYGVQPTKSTTVPVRDGSGMLEQYAEVDKQLVMMAGDGATFRASEDSAHLTGMNQDMLDTVIYGNVAVNPERFTGLAPRFSSTAVESGQNIIKAGGAGADNTSIWLVVWGSKTVHGFFPKGSKGGISTQDLGEQTLFDANGGRYQGYRTHYKWDAGLTVRDWRYVVRIANIDVSDMTKDAATGADLVDLMTQAVELLPPGFESAGSPVFYANRTVRSILRRQIKNAKNMNLNLEEVSGKKVITFDGIPVRRVDAILNTEAAIA